MLSTLFIAQLVRAVAEALAAAGAPAGAVGVIDQARLARALGERGHPVLLVGTRPRSLRRARGRRVYGARAALPVRDAALAALVGLGAGDETAWEDELGEWSRAVADGGALVVVDRCPPGEASRRALCAGLVDIEQRAAGRLVVTSGRVARV